jgi:hypothetical protein
MTSYGVILPANHPMKVLTVNQMLEAAMLLKIPEYGHHAQALEIASTALAHSLAKHLQIKVLNDATWEGEEMEGLAADFGPSYENQPCPEILQTLDKGGDWFFLDE